MYELSAAHIPATTSLEPVYAWGLSAIHFLQSFASPALTFVAKAFTALGEPYAYLLIIPLILWCVDERRGFRIAFSVFLSNGINVALKQNLRVERPFMRDPSVKLIDETGFSTPSGHSQNSAAFWPQVVARLPTRSRLALAIGLPLCIGLSRAYLGVHYPTDVFLGWAIGALIAVCTLFALPALERAVAESRLPWVAAIRSTYRAYRDTSGSGGRSLKLLLAAAIAFALNAASRGDSTMGGLLFGLSCGYILLREGVLPRGLGVTAPRPADAAGSDEASNPGGDDAGEPNRKPAFQATRGSLPQKALRYAVGMAGLAAIYLGVGLVLPGSTSPYYSLGAFARFGLVGFWATWGAPVIFIRTKLA